MLLTYNSRDNAIPIYMFSACCRLHICCKSPQPLPAIGRCILLTGRECVIPEPLNGIPHAPAKQEKKYIF